MEFMVRSLVDQPDEVTVNVIEGEKSTILELHVAEGDIGKVIGKQGRIAKAIRTILSASATRDGKRAVWRSSTDGRASLDRHDREDTWRQRLSEGLLAFR